MEDSEIIGLYHSRSEEALSQTAQKYGGYCRSIAWNILGNVLDAEETLNDTWLAAWNSIPPQKPRRLNVYLGRITRNLALNRLKAQNTQKRGGGQTEAVLDELRECVGIDPWDDKISELVLRDALNRFLRRQFPLRRAVFLRRYWAMEPIEDIAKALGLRRGQTRTILYRMRMELKEELEKEEITI